MSRCQTRFLEARNALTFAQQQIIEQQRVVSLAEQEVARRDAQTRTVLAAPLCSAEQILSARAWCYLAVEAQADAAKLLDNLIENGELAARSLRHAALELRNANQTLEAAQELNSALLSKRAILKEMTEELESDESFEHRFRAGQ